MTGWADVAQWTPWKTLTPLSSNPRMRGACTGPVRSRSGEAVQGPGQRLQVQPPPVNQKLGVEPTSGVQLPPLLSSWGADPRKNSYLPPRGWRK